VEDGSDQPGDVAVVEARDGVAQVNRDAAGMAGRQLEDTPFPAGAGQFAGVQAAIAASQSMAAITVVPSLMLVPVVMKRLVKSSRRRNVPLPARRATPASSG
jgi:hypothetical protein